MIKVEVGNDGAQWLLHESRLTAHSGFAKAAITHDVREKADHTIKMPEARPEAFDLFANYLYTEELDATSLSLDDLVAAYVLADHVDCPAFADVIFERILYVLSNTLDDQRLRILLLDLVGRRILENQYNFSAKEYQDLLQPVMEDSLCAVMRFVANKAASVSGNLLPSIGQYHKHVSRHASSKDVPNGPQPAVPFQVRMPETDEERIAHNIIRTIIVRSGTHSKDIATRL
jgi:BTB/POZ domain